jgi:hypothetical protein
MSAGNLVDPKVITDLKQRIVYLLPVGFYFNDKRWEMIWERYEKKGGYFIDGGPERVIPG